MNQDDYDVPIDQIQDGEDDVLDPEQANDLGESIRSGGDRDDDELTEDVEDENRQPGISPNNE